MHFLMSWAVLHCTITVKTKNRFCSRGILKTVKLLTEVEAYYTKKGTMEAMEVSYLAV